MSENEPASPDPSAASSRNATTAARITRIVQQLLPALPDVLELLDESDIDGERSPDSATRKAAMTELAVRAVAEAFAGDRAAQPRPDDGDIFDDDVRRAARDDTRAASVRRSGRAGAQWIPHLLAGGVIVAPDALAKLPGSQIVLRFDHNDEAQRPQVALFVDGVASEAWRTPTDAECAAVHAAITPNTSAKSMVALFTRVTDVDLTGEQARFTGGAMRFIGFQPDVDSDVDEARGFRESIPCGYFDTLCSEGHLLAGVDVGGPQATPGGFASYRLFSGANVGHPLLTDTVTPGSLAGDQTLVVKKLRVEVQLAPGFIGAAYGSALETLRVGMQLTLSIGCKPFMPKPAEPTSTGLFEYPIGGVDGLAIPARQGFCVDLRLPPAVREILSIRGTIVRVWIDGEITRDVT